MTEDAAPLAQPFASSRPVRITPDPPPDVVFYCCDLYTGRILTELPLSAGGQPLQVLIGQDATTQLTLPIFDPRCPDDWADMLAPGKTMIVQTLDGVPAAGWPVLDVAYGASTVPVTVATLETMAVRTNVADLDVISIDAAEVAALVAVPLWTNFGVVVDYAEVGKRIDGVYQASATVSVFDTLNQLMAADGGPEWALSVEWADVATRQGFTKRLQIGPRIGADRPDAVFDLDADGRGCIASYTRTRSYDPGKGATAITVTVDGSGTTRPVSPEHVSTLVNQGWPKWEGRVNLSTLSAASTLDEDAELDARAAAELATQEQGTVTWAVTGDETAPRPGRDFGVGDTVRIEVAPQGRADPHGGSASVRVQGWTHDLASGQVTPILWDDSSDTGMGV